MVATYITSFLWHIAILAQNCPQRNPFRARNLRRFRVHHIMRLISAKEYSVSKNRVVILLGFALVLLALLACDAGNLVALGNPTSTPSRTPRPTFTPRPTLTLTPADTSTPGPT